MVRRAWPGANSNDIFARNFLIGRSVIESRASASAILALQASNGGEHAVHDLPVPLFLIAYHSACRPAARLMTEGLCSDRN